MSKYEEYVAERIKIINDKNKANKKIKQFKEEIEKIFNELPNEKGKFYTSPINGFLTEYALKKNVISEQELNNYYFNNPDASSREFIQKRENESQRTWDLVKSRLSKDIFEDVNLDYLAVEIIKSKGHTYPGLTVAHILFENENYKNKPINLYNIASDAFKLPECYCDAENKLGFINKFVEDIIKYKKIMGLDFEHQKKLLKNKINKKGLNGTLYEGDFYRFKEITWPNGECDSCTINYQRELLNQCRKILKGESRSKYTNEQIEKFAKQLNDNINIAVDELDKIVKSVDEKTQRQVLEKLFKYYKIESVHNSMSDSMRNQLISTAINHEKEYDEKEYEKVVEKLEYYSQKRIDRELSYVKFLETLEKETKEFFNSDQYKDYLEQLELTKKSKNERVLAEKEQNEKSNEQKKFFEEASKEVYKNKNFKKICKIYDKHFKKICKLEKKRHKISDLSYMDKRKYTEEGICSKLLNGSMEKEGIENMISTGYSFLDKFIAKYRINKIYKLTIQDDLQKAIKINLELKKEVDEKRRLEDSTYWNLKKEFDLLRDKNNKLAYKYDKMIEKYPYYTEAPHILMDRNYKLEEIEKVLEEEEGIEKFRKEQERFIPKRIKETLSIIDEKYAYRNEHPNIENDLIISEDARRILWQRNKKSATELEKEIFDRSNIDEVKEELLKEIPSEIVEKARPHLK